MSRSAWNVAHSLEKVYVPAKRRIDGRVFYSVLSSRPDIYLDRRYNKHQTFSKGMAQEIAKKLRCPGLNVRILQMEDRRYMVYVKRARKDFIE